jgi:ribosomal protein L37AE/L43A
MAIFRITSQTKVPAYAKQTIRYITHRRDRNRQNITRSLYARHGISDKTEAYEAIDNAIAGTTFFRLVVSPDPTREDTTRDLDLRALMEQTMQTVQSRFPHQKIQYFAALHTDHSKIRHVHVLALITGRFSKQDLRVIRQAATAHALTQRAQRDQDRQQDRQQAQGQMVAVAEAKTPPRLRHTSTRYMADLSRQSTERAGGPRQNPSCLNCGPGIEMQRISRTLFHCAGCGMLVKYPGRGIEVVRRPQLEMSFEKEASWA